MQRSIGLAIGGFILATGLGMVAGFYWPVSLLCGVVMAGLCFFIAHRMQPRQHHGHTKSSVLRNAHASILNLEPLTLTEFQKSLAELRYDQGLARSGQPGEQSGIINPDNRQLEDTRVITGSGEQTGSDEETPSGMLYDTDFPPSARFYRVDVTVVPTEKDTGGHTHYEPDALELVIATDPGKPPHVPETPPVTIIGVEVHNGARFLPASEKLEGKQRLRIHFAVIDPRARKLRFSYYFEQFGYIEV